MKPDYINEKYGVELYCGRCEEIVSQLPKESVDAVITDPPYGTTACQWDTIIPFDTMWNFIKHIRKDNAAVVLFGSQPFTSLLITSNINEFKYCLIWEKDNATGFQMASKRPLKKHEDIILFNKFAGVYNPQGLKRYNKINKRGKMGDNWSELKSNCYIQEYTNYPTSLLMFQKDKGIHPTQKPVKLMEYLIKTYTNEGDTVLDFTCGSGTTGVAAVNTGRKFIGVEMDRKYFDIAVKRIEKAIEEAESDMFRIT